MPPLLGLNDSEGAAPVLDEAVRLAGSGYPGDAELLARLDQPGAR